VGWTGSDVVNISGYQFFAWLFTMFFSYFLFSLFYLEMFWFWRTGGLHARMQAYMRGFGVSPLEISTVCGILDGMVTQAGVVLIVCEICSF